MTGGKRDTETWGIGVRGCNLRYGRGFTKGKKESGGRADRPSFTDERIKMGG